MTSHHDLANALRFLSVDAVEQAASGHPGLPLGMADVATVLFTRFLKFDPTRPDWADRDRFILSAGHGSALLYALSYLTGYPRMTLEEVKRFRQLGSLTPGHPEHDVSLGIEMSTGPLGQGLGTAVGFALAERMLNARFGDALVNHTTYVLASDGDMMEGISHEAGALAGHWGLSRLIVLYDDNGICIDGPTRLSFSEHTRQRFEAYGWATDAVDGHNPEAIASAITTAQKSDRPTLIACKTTIGFGAPTKAGTAATHGSPLGKEEVAGTRAKLGWPHPPFVVPDDILATWRQMGTRGRLQREVWEGDVAAHPRHEEFLRVLRGDLPTEALHEALEAFKEGVVRQKPKVATRQSSGAVLEALVPALPELIGGSADLTPSNNTRTKDALAISRDVFGGRYIHWGVREHGMAAAMNGVALHGGVIPYGGTFLVFSDYARPAIRLCALMGVRVIHVMTHDSIGLGEDGPTHQPVEHLASLRAIPNIRVFRPADGVEVAECWELALRHTGPSILALSRQALPTHRTEPVSENLCARGGYVLAEASAPLGARQVSLLATGSEVSLAMDAREQLEKEGVATAVISLPSLELFAQQPLEYQHLVLGTGCVRVGVEAAVRQGWDGLLGPWGDFVGMTGFGASAPAEALYTHFGLTSESIVACAKRLIRAAGGNLPRHSSKVLI